jgi:Na+-transporting methylmalonyl-CoA/oxaloacetate decarboxylase gamma subunit
MATQGTPVMANVSTPEKMVTGNPKVTMYVIAFFVVILLILAYMYYTGKIITSSQCKEKKVKFADEKKERKQKKDSDEDDTKAEPQKPGPDTSLIDTISQINKMQE